MKKRREVGDEGGGITRTGAKVREPYFEFQNRGSDVQVACGSGQRHAYDDRGRPVVAPAEGSFASGPGPKSVGWVSFKGASGPVLKGARGWAEGLSSQSPVGSGWGKVSKEHFGPLILEAHPSTFGEPAFFRAPFANVGDNVGMKQELLAVGEIGVEGASLNRLKLTDEALLDEASRYPFHHKLSLLSLGLGASSPSPFLGPVGIVMRMEGTSSGLFEAAEGARSRVPLREEMSEVFSAREGRILAPWAAGGGASGSELAIVPFGLGLESPLAERMALHLEEGEGEEGWSSSCLAKFSRCLGMLTEGFSSPSWLMF
ncbi:uncharacterized protein LOC117924334 [Vitis riparia]|uniref:uncharacterized protein LOC117924334 n=1 Tax=Vitis riparia TaxID=96939 RepID=UPI00155AD541|nr:uncharacterized protein LOC117924334 [Vitis riparia]